MGEDMGLQQSRRELHRASSRRIWSSGEWCCHWRAKAHSHRRPKEGRQFKESTFLGHDRLLLQEREYVAQGVRVKYTAIAWVVDGDHRVRCSTVHLRALTTPEQTLCPLRGRNPSQKKPRRIRLTLAINQSSRLSRRTLVLMPDVGHTIFQRLFAMARSFDREGSGETAEEDDFRLTSNLVGA